jgi:hypothetical protein
VSGVEQVPPYYLAAQEVRAELGLHDRCNLTDVSGRQNAYRWCLLFELGGHTFAVKGDEDGTEPAERELIKQRLRGELLNHINDYGL